MTNDQYRNKSEKFYQNLQKRRKLRRMIDHEEQRSKQDLFEEVIETETRKS